MQKISLITVAKFLLALSTLILQPVGASAAKSTAAEAELAEIRESVKKLYSRCNYVDQFDRMAAPKIYQLPSFQGCEGMLTKPAKIKPFLCESRIKCVVPGRVAVTFAVKCFAVDSKTCPLPTDCRDGIAMESYFSNTDNPNHYEQKGEDANQQTK